jgi:hypothetical protein
VDDDFTWDRARGWDEQRRQHRVSRSPAHDAPEGAALTRWPLPRRPGSYPRHCGVAQRQVFGLMGRPIPLCVARPEFLVAVASQPEHFLTRTSASDGSRSHSPLRGSPGFAPGSLLTHPRCRGEPLRGIRYVVVISLSMARLSQDKFRVTGYSIRCFALAHSLMCLIQQVYLVFASRAGTLDGGTDQEATDTSHATISQHA